MNTTKITCLGIDLSSNKGDTVACLLTVHEEGQIIVNSPVTSCTDEELKRLIDGEYQKPKGAVEIFLKPHAIGIDAPFGWPTAFVEAVQEWKHDTWEGNANESLRDKLRLRMTDLYIRKKRGRKVKGQSQEGTSLLPFSVSADKIASVAMRAMSLLYRYSVQDKSGMTKINNQYFFEVYPAASLDKWTSITTQDGKKDVHSYKSGNHASETCEQMLKRICSALPQLSFNDSSDSKYCKSDHAFDALISALTAYAAIVEKTILPSEAKFDNLQFERPLPDLAKIEGWIHVPNAQLNEIFKI